MVITILFIIILIIISTIIIYQNQYEKYSIKNRSQVLLFKTHKWTPQIEIFCLKLFAETAESNTDFFILMHTDNGKLIKKIIDLNLRSRTITYTENQIANLYKKGFYGMWLSNHWILMWFYQSHKYSFYWTIEYDVRISGDSKPIWNYNGTEDFIYPMGIWQDPNWYWRNHYSGIKLNSKNKFYGYLQLTRYSKKFLDYLDQNFKQGENGQDEMTIFSLLLLGKFTHSKTLLNSMIDRTWSVVVERSPEFTLKYQKSTPDKTIIYHPIK